jgi:hypothetical protein
LRRLFAALAPARSRRAERCDALARHDDSGTAGQSDALTPGVVVVVVLVEVDVVVAGGSVVLEAGTVVVVGGTSVVLVVGSDVVVTVLELVLVGAAVDDVEEDVDVVDVLLVLDGAVVVDVVLDDATVVDVVLGLDDVDAVDDVVLVGAPVLDVELVVLDDVVGGAEDVVAGAVLDVLDVLLLLELDDVLLLELVDVLLVVELDVLVLVVVDVLVDDVVLDDVEVLVLDVLVLVLVDVELVVATSQPMSLIRSRASDGSLSAVVYDGSMSSFGVRAVSQWETDDPLTSVPGAYICTWPLACRPAVSDVPAATTVLPVQWRSASSIADAARCASVMFGHVSPRLWSSRNFMKTSSRPLKRAPLERVT